MTKPANQRENQKLQQKTEKSKNLNKTDVKLLSIDKYVESLLSNLAINSFKHSSIAHKNQLAKKLTKTRSVINH